MTKSHSFKSRLKFTKSENKSHASKNNCIKRNNALNGNHPLAPSSSLPDVVQHSTRYCKTPTPAKQMTHPYCRPRTGSLDAVMSAVKGKVLINWK